MTHQSRLHQTSASGSKPRGLRFDSNFLSTLLTDDLIDSRNSIGLLHPSVWESLLEDTHGILNHPTRKLSLTNPRKNSKNADTSDIEKPERELNVKKKITTVDFLTSDDEETPKYGATLNRNKSSKNTVPNIRNQIIIDDLLASDDEGKPKYGATLHRSKGTKNVVSNIRRKVIIDDFLISDDEERPKHGATSNGTTKNTKTVQFNIRKKNTTDDFMISSDEEPLKYRTTSNRIKSSKNIMSNVRKKIDTTDNFLRSTNEEKLNKTKGAKNVLSNVRKKIVDKEPLSLTEITNKSNSRTVSNETKPRKGSTYKIEKQTIARDSKDVVTTPDNKKNEVSPTRKLRSNRKDSKPLRENKSISDFSIENIDWYFEYEDCYRRQCYDILSDYAVPEDFRIKSNAYTYLLIDSRRCKNRRNIDWLDFIYAIFYIGKGTGDRAFQHAKNTEKWLTNKKTGITGKKDKKFQKIEEIWASRNTIEVFKVTENITDNEAFTREAAMIDAMGLRRLCNKVSGHYQLGRAVLLKAIERCELGTTLLVEAWDIFRGKEANVKDVKPKKKEFFELFFSEESNFNSGSDDEDELCYVYC